MYVPDAGSVGEKAVSYAGYSKNFRGETLHAVVALSN